MPQVKFGKKDEPASTFNKSDDLIAVRTFSTKSLRSGPVLSPASEGINDTKLVLAFPEAGVEVYKIDESQKESIEARKEVIKASPDVRFAGGVLIDDQSGEPIIYTENLFIKFTDDTDPLICTKVIEETGLVIKRKVDYAYNAFFVAAPEGSGTKIFDIALSLLERKEVEYCHPEIIRKRGLKTIFPQQWHLASTTIGGNMIDAGVNVAAAHSITQGFGATIAIIDDGIDIDHIEFQSSGKIVDPLDVTLRIDDPRPKDPSPQEPENHGTACAGVACADGFTGASGVAPRARLLPVRLSSAMGSQDEGDAFHWAADHGADVISCSWGPRDGLWFNPDDPVHNQVVPIPASTKLAIDYAITNGRKGKGCVVIFAAGNGNESVDNDGYASYEKVIAVAASNDTGKRSVYSDFGKAVWCSFPSSDFGFAKFNHPDPLTPGIWTTDRMGLAGYNSGKAELGDLSGNFTNAFGGTSSACPGVAGVAALIISANPSLSVSEIREIIKDSCDKIDTTNGNYDENGRSRLYGFGRVNAERAVQLARKNE